MSMPKRLLVVLLCFFSMIGSPVLSAGAEPPAIGQSLEQFKAAVKADLEQRGDRMGFGFSPCSLDPPFMAAEETYLARSFTQGSTGLIALVAVDESGVRGWQDFELPGFQGWVTHYSSRCDGSYLEFIDRGEVFLRYRWTGEDFVQEAVAKPR
jgi:hypothetical protein